MNSTKKKRLESKGWKVGTTAEFLRLSSEKVAQIEGNKRVLSKTLRDPRKSDKKEKP